MSHSISASGKYSNELFSIEATLLYPQECVPPLNQFIVYNISINCMDSSIAIDLRDFSFYLMCKNKIHNTIAPKDNMDLRRYIEYADAYGQFYGTALIGNSIKQSIDILFESIPETSYTETAIVFDYKDSKELHKINLTY